MPPLSCKPDLAYVPPLSISSTFDSIPSTSDDDNEDENPPPPPQDIPSTPQLPKWIYSTRDATGSLACDPADQCRTCSYFDRASSLLPQVPENHDLDTFEETSGHPKLDANMNE